MQTKLPKGFTLIELIVVITIIAVLSTIALFGIGKVQASARDVKRASIMNGIRTALERYYADNQKYPVSGFGQMMAALTAGGYLSVAPTDPNTVCTTAVPATGSWTPCTTTYPAYIYDSSTTAYNPGVSAGCTLTQGCYALWLKTESSGGNTIQAYLSPQ